MISLLASVFLILANLLAYGTAQPWCFDNGNYTNSSSYAINFHTLLSSLSTNVDDNGFYNASMGQNPDTVYASVLCRADVQLPTCRTCIQNATTDTVRSCPNEKQAVQFSELCTLRYSDEPFFGIMETTAAWYWWNPENASSPDQFMADVRTLVDNLRDQAAHGDSLRKVAAGNRSTVDFQTVFSLVQCTPDLSSEDCSSCLIGATTDIPKFCRNKTGCRVLKPNCILRYEVSPFFNETRLQEIQTRTIPPVLLPPSSSTPLGPPPPPGKKDDSKTRTIIIVVVSIGVCLIAVVCIGIMLIKRTKKKPIEKTEPVDNINVPNSLQYEFCGIKAATNDFSYANKLGQGGFGAVYKGKLPNGQEIAVKRLSIGSNQGDVEFKNEVLLLAKLQHRNLVRLLGFSMVGEERLLIYEFVKNASLDKFIFDRTKRNYLDWERRYKIIGGISRGLLYLHEESRVKIIHRDLKASNILLDGEMNPKIADFGVARLCDADETQGNTDRIVGTLVSAVLPFCRQSVLEFYVNLSSGVGDERSAKYGRVYVRNRIYNFTPRVINQLYNTPEVDDGPHPDIHEVTAILTVGLVKIFPAHPGRLSAAKLTSLYSILHKVAIRNWTPSSNSTVVTRSQDLTLYSIGTETFNFGRLAFKTILQFAEGGLKCSRLPFPSLIYGILYSQGFIRAIDEQSTDMSDLLKIVSALLKGNRKIDVPWVDPITTPQMPNEPPLSSPTVPTPTEFVMLSTLSFKCRLIML